MRALIAAALILALATPSLALAQRNRNQQAPVVANPEALAVYVQPGMLDARHYFAQANLWLEPGEALSQALREVGAAYFPNQFLMMETPGRSARALLAMQAEWKDITPRMRLVLDYTVYDANGNALHSGKADQAVRLSGMNFNAAATNASRLAVQEMMRDVQTALSQSALAELTPAPLARFDRKKLVDTKEPYRTGTAFFINQQGQ